MLINQARNLASLPYSALTQLEAVDPAQTEQLLAAGAAHRLQRDRDQPGVHDHLPAELSGSRPRRSSSSATRRPAGRTRSPASRTRCTVQAGVVQNLDTTRTQIDALVSSSQSATGALQALQSGNQLIALQTKQLADLTAVLAAIARAQSLDGARNVENEEQAQVQLSQFLSYGRATSPRPCRCSTDARLASERSPARVGSFAVAAAIAAPRRCTSGTPALSARISQAGVAATVTGRSARAGTRPLRRDRHGGEGRCALRSRLGREPAALLCAGRRRVLIRPAANAGAEASRNERHRRHRQFSRHLHPVHRFRLRPAAGRCALARRRADRDRHHAWPASSGRWRRTRT